MRKKKYSKNGCEDMAADGSIVIVADFDDRKAQAELNRLARRIDSLGEKIRQDSAARLPLLEQAKRLGIQLDAAKAKLAEMQAAASGTYSANQIAKQRETVKALQTQWDAVQKQVEGYDRSIANSTAKLEAAEVQAGQLTARLTDTGEAGETAGQETAAGFNFASTALGKLERRIIGLAKRVFIFSVITRALRSLRTWFVNTVKANDEAAAAMGQFKAALLTLAYPIMQVIVPALTWLINALSRVVTAVTSFVAALFGASAEEWAASAEALFNEQEAIKGVGNAAEKSEKQLASFDEINKLSGSDGGGFDGGSSSGAIKPLFEAIKNFQLPGWLDKFATNLGVTLHDVFFKWDDLTPEDIAKKALVGVFGIAGAIIGFSLGGFWGGGLGLTLGTVLGVTISNLLFDGDGELSKGEITKLLRAVGIGVIGALVGFAFGGFWGAALGLTLGVVLGVIINEVFFDSSEEMKTTNAELEQSIESVAQASLDASADVATAAQTASGNIAIAARDAKDEVMDANAAMLGNVSETLNSINNETATKLSQNTGIIRNWRSENAGETGNVPRATREMASAVESFANNAVSNMEKFGAGSTEAMERTKAGTVSAARSMVKGLAQNIYDALSVSAKNVVEFGRVEVDVMNAAGIGVNKAAEGTAKSIVDRLREGLQTAINNFMKFSSATGVEFQGNQVHLDPWSTNGVGFSGGMFTAPLFSFLPIPALAQGAVIPPNREFLAVLGDQKSGTNIEAPLETIVAAFRQALSERRGGNQTVILQIDKHELGRVTYDAYNTESQRVGIQLGGALT